MTGHISVGPLKVMCDISSVGTLARVRTIETCDESILPPYLKDSQ
jgi:hypothetical protein